jgi:hypothetical protein
MIGTTAINNAKQYDWGDWFLGLFRAFTAALSVTLITFSGMAAAGVPTRQKFIALIFTFLGGFAYRLGEFLQLQGAPEQLQRTLDRAAALQEKAGDAIAQAQSQAPPKP